MHKGHIKTKQFVTFFVTSGVLLSNVLAFMPVLDVHATNTIEKDGVTITRISNPDAGQREVDGLVGDRENSYAWRLAERGDYIYIATSKNVVGGVIDMYGGLLTQAGMDKDTLWAIADTVTNGEVPRKGDNIGANIISYNKTTGEFKTIYSADDYSMFRMAVTFGDDVYFGSYSSVPNASQYILKLDEAGNFTKVYTSTGAISFRANTVYDNHLFFAGADDREVVADGDGNPTKLAVLQKSNEDDTVWTRVADYKDFGEYAYDAIMSSWAGAPIWELSTYKGYIYATLPSSAGFIMFRGRPATSDEEANEYGWHWEEVVGNNNGINEPGLSSKKGGEPGTMLSLIGSTFVFKDQLYAFNFDHGAGGELMALMGLISQLSGADVKASDYLKFIYDTLKHSQSIWKYNDETGKFEECEGFTKLVEGTTNEYVWRAGEYDGQMYLATFDAATIYNYLTRLTNGSFFEMTEEEMKEQIGHIEHLIGILSESELYDKLDLDKYVQVLEFIKNMLATLSDTEDVNYDSVKSFLDEHSGAIGDLESAFDGPDGMSEDVFRELVDKYLSDEVMTEMLDEYLTIDNIKAIVDRIFEEIDLSGVSAYTTDEQKEELLNKIKEALDYEEGKKISVDNLTKEKIRETMVSYLDENFQSSIEMMKEKLIENYSKIDWEGLRMYLEISEMVRKDNWGFDLIRTSDGEHFELITDDGFGDKYNYGASAFLPTDKGLYIGTCNPFYGGQLYLLTTGNEKSEEYEVIEGVGQTYTRGGGDLVFKINADYSLFENGGKVYVDEVLVDEDSYTSRSGSTIIALKQAYLDTLSAGDHAFTVVLNNGKTATTTFTIAESNAILAPNAGSFTKLTAEASANTLVIVTIIISILAAGAVVCVRRKR